LSDLLHFAIRLPPGREAELGRRTKSHADSWLPSGEHGAIWWPIAGFFAGIIPRHSGGVEHRNPKSEVRFPAGPRAFRNPKNYPPSLSNYRLFNVFG
jgi:hypothetical protein